MGAPGGPTDAGRRPEGRVMRLVREVRWGRVAMATGVGLALGVAGAVYYELRTSALQARLFADRAALHQWRVEPGPSDRILFPEPGPYDIRLGHAGIGQFLKRLEADGAQVEAQARWTPELLDDVRRGLSPAYREKMFAGLEVQDRDGVVLASSRFPERGFDRFEDVPRLVREALLFIENRELLVAEPPTRNPAVEWDRMALAVAQLAGRAFEPERKVQGASTLATQLEKFRHSLGGRTHGTADKLRQMAQASLRAYREGEDTTATRRDILLQYVNTVPLGAAPPNGEVHGLADGLRSWFGADFDTVRDLLADDFATLPGSPDHARRGTAFRQVVALFVAQRRPRHFLTDDRDALGRLVDVTLHALHAQGRIDVSLRDAALRAPLVFRAEVPRPAPVSFFERKATDAVRTHLLSRLGVRDLYALDRLDLTVRTSFDQQAQRAASELLVDLGEPTFARSAGLTKPRLLGRGDPGQVLYSFTLFEQTEGANVLRVQTDGWDGPFNLNDGMKLELGSTAKLRTLVTYLDLVAELWTRLSPLDHKALRAFDPDPADALGQWAVQWLERQPAARRSMRDMLLAAMQRTYSASPHERFMTGGGLHTFGNFDDDDDDRTFTVSAAMDDSVNLVFVRLMRDVVRHLMFQVPGSSARLLRDAADPRRKFYLARFADVEGRVFQEQFFRKYRGKSPDEALDLLALSVKPTPRRLAVIFRTVRPEAGLQAFADFVGARLPPSELTQEGIVSLYERYGPERFSLSDRGFLAKVHPLELHTVAWLQRHPGAGLAGLVEGSREERQSVYGWLFKTSRKNAQDKRIREMLELEAFLALHTRWSRVGYPFPALVPSLATALGSSGDRPTALAELLGILNSGGMRLPMQRVESLHFAVDTPYETRVLRGTDASGERVLPAEVAAIAREAALGVVERGTAKRVKGAFQLSDGRVLEVGGKTGTGDNRRDEFARGGVKIASHVTSRTATFAFFVGERHFGVVTAYVPGPQAAEYDFTSALPTTVLKLLAPRLVPSLFEPGARVSARQVETTVVH